MDGHCQFNKRFNHTYDIFCCILYYSDNTWFHYIIYGYMGLFDIYNKQDRRIIMAKEKEDRLKKVLEDMSYSLNHIEDISADNRAIIVKLVKQSNQIVEFLKQLEIDVDEQYGIEAPPSFSETLNLDSDKMEELRELWDDFKSKKEDLKEFEDELKKHKDKLTPGQVGES